MVRARAGKGLGFVETPQSVLGEIHLNYGEVCGLYDEEGPEPEEMLAGFVIHNLAMFPQSYPRPDLTHLPPEHVYECGEVGARARSRAAREARRLHSGGPQKSASDLGLRDAQAAGHQFPVQDVYPDG